MTAEEAGLLGSEYYAAHPLFPPGKTAVDINYDALYPFGRTSDVVVGGAERTTFYPTVEAVAKRMNLMIAGEGHPEQGHYYRSDHFSMAHVGIPSFTVSMGTQYEGKPADFYDKIFENYNDKHYHRPVRRISRRLGFHGHGADGAVRLPAGDRSGETRAVCPRGRAGDEFLGEREKSGVRR